MKFLPGKNDHVYNQGNNHERLFNEDSHYHFFLELYQAYISPFCHTLCWCLMPNHFHFLIHTDPRVLDIKRQGGLFLDPVTNGFRKLLSTYTPIDTTFKTIVRGHYSGPKQNQSVLQMKPKMNY